MGTWTGDVFLDSEVNALSNKGSVSEKKKNPFFLLHLQEFITESIFSYWRSTSSALAGLGNGEGRLRRGWKLILSKTRESPCSGRKILCGQNDLYCRMGFLVNLTWRQMSWCSRAWKAIVIYKRVTVWYRLQQMCICCHTVSVFVFFTFWLYFVNIFFWKKNAS